MSASQDGEDALAAKPQGPEWPYDPKDRVVLGAKGLTVGVLVAYVTFSLLLSIPSVTVSGTWSWIFAIFLFAAIPALVIGLIIGAMLEVCLRRLRNQWLHVAAFFAAGAAEENSVDAE